jgi:DNA-binding MarR family transcriptional regulator
MPDEAKRTARLMLETLPSLMQSIASEMRRCDHPMPMPHFRALMTLSQGPFTLSELAEHQRVSLPTMSNTVTVLVNNGWAERVADAGDRRKADVVMTAEGIRALREMESRIENVIAGSLAKLDGSELGNLTDALGVLQRAFATRDVVEEPAVGEAVG